MPKDNEPSKQPENSKKENNIVYIKANKPIRQDGKLIRTDKTPFYQSLEKIRIALRNNKEIIIRGTGKAIIQALNIVEYLKEQNEIEVVNMSSETSEYEIKRKDNEIVKRRASTIIIKIKQIGDKK
ncbi:MAG: hypothetical protein J7K26_00380 [Candidatus Aenigmarchaeota archaeon]|nr:hypothetical protein [Candidatus Aenigmarchaeota archaeon]